MAKTKSPKKSPGRSSIGSVPESNGFKISAGTAVKSEPSEPTPKEPFRYRWQRKPKPRQPVAAANEEGASEKPITNGKQVSKSKGRKNGDDDDDEFMVDDVPKKPSKKADKQQHPPPMNNGRCYGRKLVPWHSKWSCLH